MGRKRFYENDMFESLLDIIDKITANIPDDHKYHYFWCPKKKDSACLNGFRLYVHGGYALSLYVDDKNNKVRCTNNIFKYKEYFEDKTFLKNLEKKTGVDRYVTINDVKDWFSSNDWDVIFTAYKKRGFVERGKETFIAKMSEDYVEGQMLIIDMESSVRNCVSIRKNPKPDLVGIRKVENKWILSFIEYKCTESGTKGVTLKTHYNDMRDYYNDCSIEGNSYYNSLFEQYIDAAISKLKQIEKRNCQKRQKIEISDIVKGEIVFLFSNIGQNGFTSQLICNEVNYLDNKCIIDNSVKFCLLGDVTDNVVQFIEPLNLKEFLKAPVFAKCDKDQWKRKKLDVQ